MNFTGSYDSLSTLAHELGTLDALLLFQSA